MIITGASTGPAFGAGPLIATVTTPVGVSGAVFLLPVQLSVLHVPSPAVTPTNLLLDRIVRTPRTSAPEPADRRRPRRALIAALAAVVAMAAAAALALPKWGSAPAYASWTRDRCRRALRAT